MSEYRQKLQTLLRELFQFDSADLDFGIYAVMNTSATRSSASSSTTCLTPSRKACSCNPTPNR